MTQITKCYAKIFKKLKFLLSEQKRKAKVVEYNHDFCLEIQKLLTDFSMRSSF